MPDWSNLVKEKLTGLDLPAHIKDEVIAELASHFEDFESASLETAASTDQLRWRKLARAIQCAKEEHGMNHKKALWIPIFVNLLFSSVLINVCNWLGWIDVRITQPGPVLQAFQPWLLTLPLCGATAAFLARRSQGSRAIRVTAALAPSLVWLASIPVVELIFLCIPSVFAVMPLRSLAVAATGWFVLPSLALFLGAAPFLGDREASPKYE